MQNLEVQLEYEVGEIVYLKTDIQKLPRLVHHYVIYITNNKPDVSYYLVCGELGNTCTPIELTRDRGFINTIGFNRS